jgi:AraC-like DNA-binding protein/Flp pilus assembly protein TadD
MIHKSVLTVILTFLLFLTSASAQDDFQHTKDSLLNLIAILQGEEKLDAYNQLHSIYFEKLSDKNSLADFLTFSALYREECLKQNQMKRAGDALVNDIIACTRCYRFDELEERAAKSMEFLKNNQQTEGAYVIYQQLILSYCRRNQYDKALNELLQNSRLAKTENDLLGMFYTHFLMGIVYMHQDRLVEAEQNYRQSIEAAENIEPKPQKLIDVHMELCNMLQATERFEDFFAQAQQAETLLKKLESQNRNKLFGTEWENLWTLYAFAHDSQGDYDRAETYCNRIDSINNGNPVSMGNTHLIRSHILDARGQYSEALERINRAIALDPAYLHAYHTKIKILSHLEKAPQTWTEVEKTISYTDSVRNASFNVQLDELRTRYEVDRHIMEKERNRNYFLFAAAACFLVVMAWVFHSRSILRKNRELVRKNRQWAGIAEVGNTASEQKPDTEETLANSDIPDKTDEAVMNEIYKLMENDIYKDCHLTLDMLAEQTGYHSNYISNAINRCTGKNFKTYINEYRIKAAIRILSDKSNSKNITVDAVAFDSGFSDRKNFHRVFKKITGLSPTDFKNSLLS